MDSKDDKKEIDNKLPKFILNPDKEENFKSNIEIYFNTVIGQTFIEYSSEFISDSLSKVEAGFRIFIKLSEASNSKKVIDNLKGLWMLTKTTMSNLEEYYKMFTVDFSVSDKSESNTESYVYIDIKFES